MEQEMTGGSGYSRTGRGKPSDRNEDNYIVKRVDFFGGSARLYGVFDGLGGVAGGAEASGVAGRECYDAVREASNRFNFKSPLKPDECQEVVKYIMDRANEAVRNDRMAGQTT